MSRKLGSFVFDAQTDLKQGSHGPQVWLLQVILIAMFLRHRPKIALSLPLNALFGGGTQRAVRDFQILVGVARNDSFTADALRAFQRITQVNFLRIPTDMLVKPTQSRRPFLGSRVTWQDDALFPHAAMLDRGSRGAAVLFLQVFLVSFFLDGCEDMVISGTYDRRTMKQVSRLQSLLRSRGSPDLPQNGHFDSATREALYRHFRLDLGCVKRYTGDLAQSHVERQSCAA